MSILKDMKMGIFTFPIIINEDNDYIKAYKKRIDEYIDYLNKLSALKHLSYV